MGNALADQVLAAVKSARARDDGYTLRCAHETFRFDCVLNVGDPLVKLTLSRAFFPALVDSYAHEYRDGVRPELKVAMLGDVFGLAGFSGELFCGHALSLRRRARLDHLMVFGCCNDYQQYFPTIEAMAEGGYGATPPIAMAEAGAGERMVDRALIHLYRLRGTLPDQ
jgi:hypothetical protein